ncbi:MAG TPA: DUF1684 domain-containing protein [Actinomycetaceae bacterium]|nr:DUF1684 domain-containing protein [Actinomycetaceae bacterium]
MSTSDPSSDTTAVNPAWQEFRARREQGLSAPHGVLAQVALHWIEPGAGPQTVPGVPGQWQLIADELAVTWEGESLRLLTGAPEVEVDDQDGTQRATVLSTADVRLARFGDDVEIEVIGRGGRTGLRILDPSAPRLTGFTGVPTYPYDPALVVTGTWRARPAMVTVGAALPWLEHELPSPGFATVEIGGQRLDLVLTGESSILFTDQTSGASSADWRVVSAELDGEAIRLDLNYAVNPPAAFSTWATCPRPPHGNHIPTAVRAGEQRVEQTER